MKRIDASRRQFLQTAGQLSVAGVAAPFALNLAGIGAAAAQSANTGYKALVCVFLSGANDHNNTVIPFDDTTFAAYTKARPSIARQRQDLTGSKGQSLELKTVVPLNGGQNAGRSFALPKELERLKPMWDESKLAVLANVGPLIVPLTASNLLNSNTPKPAHLFSHNDQQATWQSVYPDSPNSGWGGRMGDLLFDRGANANSVFTLNSVGGGGVLFNGQKVSGYQVDAGGSVSIAALTGKQFGSNTAKDLINSLIRSGGTHPFTQDLAATTARSIGADMELQAVLGAGGVAPDFPLIGTDEQASDLAAQLRVVARMISGQAKLGATRQVFFVSIGSFDTHSDQLNRQPALHTDLAAGLAYFNRTLKAMNMFDQVTTFTASDFGRALVSNGDGCDHGWGGHHFIMGGSVKGGQFYGTFAQLLGGYTDFGNGRVVPTTSVDEYSATLARWFGVTSPSDMKLVLPNLGAFDTPNLGFMV